MAIKIKKILEAGKVVYPATILDAVRDAKSVKVEDVETNKWYGKTLREILVSQANGSNEALEALKTKLYGTPAQGTEGQEGYVPAVMGDIEQSAADTVAKIVANAPEDFDTLKEIADWIAKDKNNAEGFDAANRIVELETKVGVPASGEGEDVVEASGLYKAIEDAVADANSAIDDLEVEETTIKNAETDEVVSFKYKEEDGIVTISDLNVVTSTLGEVGLSQGEDGKWVEGTANAAKGLATAADVAAELVNDEKVIAGALNSLNDRLAVFEDGDASVAKQIENAIDALDVEEDTVGDGNVTVTYSEENGVVTISDVAVAEATAAFTAATETEAAKLEVATADAAKLLNAGSVAAIKSYVDDRFSTEACTDTTDYDDVF